jgi:hypothetical protein
LAYAAGCILRFWSLLIWAVKYSSACFAAFGVELRGGAG